VNEKLKVSSESTGGDTCGELCEFATVTTQLPEEKPT
jgi:hypothetical protein